MEEIAGATSSLCEALRLQELRIGVRPIERGIPGAVEAEPQLSHHTFITFFFVLLGDSYEEIPCGRGIKVCPLHIYGHDAVWVCSSLRAAAH